MLFIKLSLLPLVCFQVWASGGGGEAEAEGGAKEVSKDQREFSEKTSKLNSLENRILEANKKFNELVHHKASAHSPEEKQAIIKEMLDVSRQRNKDVEAYNKLRTETIYRYPDKGEGLNRRYQTQSKKSLEELEGVVGLDEMLSRIKNVIERKYSPFIKPDEPAPRPAQVAQPEESKPKRLRLEK